MHAAAPTKRKRRNDRAPRLSAGKAGEIFVRGAKASLQRFFERKRGMQREKFREGRLVCMGAQHGNAAKTVTAQGGLNV